MTELQAAFEVAVGGAEWIFPRLGQLLGRIDDFDGPLLELHRVAARRHSYADESARQIDIAVMVDADLSDDVAWVTVADQLVANLDGHSSSHVG